MATFMTVVHIVTCVLLVLVIMIQQGKGAEISASLAGSSQTVFGSSGGANFFTRFTSVAAAIFMITSLGLTIMGNKSRKSVMEGLAAPVTVPAPGTTSVPVAPTAPLGGAPAQNTAPGQTNDAPPPVGTNGH